VFILDVIGRVSPEEMRQLVVTVEAADGAAHH